MYSKDKIQSFTEKLKNILTAVLCQDRICRDVFK